MTWALIWAMAALLLAAPAARRQPQAPAKKPAARHTVKRHATKRSKPSSATVAPERAAQIEQALVDHGYLQTVSGHWDGEAAAAMKKFQQDHHWQTRFVPDARALIALGLGPGSDSGSTRA